MADFTRLNAELAKLGSALEAFFGSQDPPVAPNDQPAVDATVKQLEAIIASIPVAGAKRPFAGLHGMPDGPGDKVLTQPQNDAGHT